MVKMADRDTPDLMIAKNRLNFLPLWSSENSTAASAEDSRFVDETEDGFMDRKNFL